MSETEPVVLRSATNATIRHLVRMRDNRARRKAARVIVDGWRETGQAIQAGLALCGIYVSETSSTEPQATILHRPDVRSKTTLVSASLMEKISYGQSSRGIVAEFEQPRWGLEQLHLQPSPFLLVLDRIEKPGNIGAIFRCADAAGVDAILLSECQDIFNPNSIRNSLGGVFHVASASGTQQQIAGFLEQNRFRVMAARVESSAPLWSVSWNGPIAVVLGNEADGLGDRWKFVGKQPVEGLQIPMAGQVDSLNVSVSAAVIAFEAIRQRTRSRPSAQ